LQMMGDWQMRCIGSNLGMEADLIGNHMPLEKFLLARGKRAYYTWPLESRISSQQP
jgi:hypothetical protein